MTTAGLPTPWRTYADPAVIDPAPTLAERKQFGRALRRTTPFDQTLAIDARMRGSELPGMGELAAAISRAPKSGLVVSLVGDIAVPTIGAVDSGDGTLLDVLNVDDALPGPWEYDVLRLAVSIGCAVPKRRDRSNALRTLAEGYRDAVQRMAREPLHTARASAREASRKLARDARPSNYAEAERRFARKGALALDRLAAAWQSPVTTAPEEMVREFAQYRETAADADAALLSRYRLADAAVAADGRVAVLLTRGGVHDALLLRASPVRESPLEAALGAWREGSDIQRVLWARELLPLAPPDLLGWSTSADGAIARVWSRGRSTPASGKSETGKGGRAKSGGAKSGGAKDGGAKSGGAKSGRAKTNAGSLTPKRARAFGTVLGLVHAGSGDAAMLAGYLGESAAFGNALAEAVESFAR